MAKQKRDNEYLMRRLENKYPGVFADWQAGKFKSPREALISVGLKQLPKQLNVLKNAWLKASAFEQAEFRRLICISGSVAPSVGSSTISSSSRRAASTSAAKTTSKPKVLVGSSSRAIDPDGYLQPWAQIRTHSVMHLRKMKMGQVMVEMGYKRLDPALGLALSGGYRIRPDMANALEQWLDNNKGIK